MTRDEMVAVLRVSLLQQGIGYTQGLLDETDTAPYIDGDVDLEALADDVLAAVNA